jgi:hypothetical protein
MAGVPPPAVGPERLVPEKAEEEAAKAKLAEPV